jgi:hypothetical protein
VHRYVEEHDDSVLSALGPSLNDAWTPSFEKSRCLDGYISCTCCSLMGTFVTGHGYTQMLLEGVANQGSDT